MHRLGADTGGVVVQPMIAPGVETIVGVTRDPSFGSLVLFGYRNTPEVDGAALEVVLLRICLLAEHVPEIAELDCNPVMGVA